LLRSPLTCPNRQVSSSAVPPGMRSATDAREACVSAWPELSPTRPVTCSPRRGDSHARPSRPRQTSRACSTSSKPSAARGRPERRPRSRSSPPRHREPQAPRSASRPAPSPAQNAWPPSPKPRPPAPDARHPSAHRETPAHPVEAATTLPALRRSGDRARRAPAEAGQPHRRSAPGVPESGHGNDQSRLTPILASGGAGIVSRARATTTIASQ
jgi:hypothetical protein